MRKWWIVSIAVPVALGWLVALIQMYGPWIFVPLQNIRVPAPLWVAAAGTLMAATITTAILISRWGVRRSPMAGEWLEWWRGRGKLGRQTLIICGGSLGWALLPFLKSLVRIAPRKARRGLAKALLWSRSVWVAAPRAECHLKSPKLSSSGTLLSQVLPVQQGQRSLDPALLQRDKEETDARTCFDRLCRILGRVTLVVYVVGFSCINGLTCLSAFLAWLWWQAKKLLGSQQMMIVVTDPPPQVGKDGGPQNTAETVEDGDRHEPAEALDEMPVLPGVSCAHPAEGAPRRIARGGVAVQTREKRDQLPERRDGGELTRVEALGQILAISSGLGVGTHLFWQNSDPSQDGYKKISDPGIADCLNIMSLANTGEYGKAALHKVQELVGVGPFAIAGPLTVGDMDFQQHLEALKAGEMLVNWPLVDWSRERRAFGWYLGPESLYVALDKSVPRILKATRFLLVPYIDDRLTEATYFLALEIYEDELESELPGLTATAGWKTYLANLERLEQRVTNNLQKGEDNDEKE